LLLLLAIVREDDTVSICRFFDLGRGHDALDTLFLPVFLAELVLTQLVFRV
jgi:hypothetical protein